MQDPRAYPALHSSCMRQVGALTDHLLPNMALKAKQRGHPSPVPIFKPGQAQPFIALKPLRPAFLGSSMAPPPAADMHKQLTLPSSQPDAQPEASVHSSAQQAAAGTARELHLYCIDVACTSPPGPTSHSGELAAGKR